MMTGFDPEKITFFARTDARGQDVSFGIKAKDRQRHMYVVGKTGMGKSTMLENMAAQDIMNGEGMAFIDPHGSAIETLLEYVPEHRIKDVVYFAPFDLEYPISFNIMEDVGPDKRHLVVSGLMSTFKKVWVDQWSARMEYILTNALLALIEYPDTTLLSVNRLFSDKTFRNKVVNYVKDPAVKAYWTEEFANYTDRFTADALPAIQNKVGQFTGNPLIRNIIGQPKSSFDIRQMMDEKKILLMNLSKGLIGETNANLLGSMLTTRIYLAAMSRANLPVEQMRQMPNFYFYVDEFQSFANATFANILSEARKYHLNLIIAHQYISQMEDEVKDAVFGNVGTSIAFRVGPFDAEVLETVFAPRFEATDLVNLGFAQIYLTLMIDGIGSQPFSAKTLPPVQLPSVSYREMVINESRKQYSSKREDIEKMVVASSMPDRSEDDKKKSNNRGGGHNTSNGKRSAPPGNGGANRQGGNNYPGNGSRSGANSGNYAADTRRDEYRPAPPQKTADDLRNILSQMAGEAGVKKGDVAEKLMPTAENGASADKQFQKNTVRPVKENKAKIERSVREEKEEKNAAADKRQKLAPGARGVTKQKTAAESFKTKLKEVPGKESSDLKSALADALKRIETPSAARQSSTPLLPKTERMSVTAMAPLTPTPTASAQQISSKTDTMKTTAEEQVRRIVIEHRAQQSDEKVETRQTTVETTAAAQPNTALDPAKIKQMLRHNNQERSPFS